MSNDKTSKKRKQADEAPETPEEKKKATKEAEADGDEKKSKRGGPRRLVRRADEGPYRSELVSLAAIRALANENAGTKVTVSSALASQIDYMFRTLAAQVAARAVRIAKDSVRGETRAIDKLAEDKKDEGGKTEKKKSEAKPKDNSEKKDGNAEEKKKEPMGPASVAVNSKAVIEAFMDTVRAHMYREVPRPKTKEAAINDLHATAMETDDHARDETEDLREEMVRAMKLYTQFRKINGDLAAKLHEAFVEDKGRAGANVKELTAAYKKRVAEVSTGDRATRKHLEIHVSISTTREILRSHVGASQVLRNTATVALAAGLSHLLGRICGGMGSMLHAQRAVAKSGPKENRRLNMDHLTGSFVHPTKRVELASNGKEREIEVSVARYPMLWNTFFKTLPLNVDICRALADTPALVMGATMPLLDNTFRVEVDA